MDKAADCGEDTGFCACPTGSGESPWSGGCEGRKHVFTKREEAVLARIREVSLAARTLKEKIHGFPGMGTGNGSYEAAASELERLRSVRKELEQERVAAAEERMRFLGHI